MGCLFSQPDHNRNLRIYKVYNVDENGDELNAGKIEVTESDLILHQRGREQIRWPLRCLRRYGWDEELFSFESGRRCPTGPGIYAFKCRRAEVLFNSVQEFIARAGEEQNRASQHFEHHSLPNSRPISLVEQRELNGFVVHTGNHLQSNSSELNYVNGSVVQDAEHNYVNTGTTSPQNGTVDTASALIDFLHDPQLRQDSTPTVNYAELDLPTSTENLADNVGMEQRNSIPLIDMEGEQETEGLPSVDTEELLNDTDVFMDEDLRQQDYMNVGPNGLIREEIVRPNQVIMRNKIVEHNYTNLPVGPLPSASNTEASTPGLNYIEVSVPKSNENLHNGAVSMTPTSPVTSGIFYHDSPRRQTASDRPYTEIDFQKTNALKSTSRTQSDVTVDDGSRKTRHNSTIS